MRKKQIIIVVIFLAVLAVFSGCGVKPVVNDAPLPIATTTEKDSSKNNDEPTATSTDVELKVWPEVSFTEEDYEGWETYTNEKLGYEVKHPTDWTINACDEGCTTKEVIINPPDAESFTSYISILLDGRSIEGIKSVLKDPYYYDGKPYKEEAVLFNNIKAIHFFGSKYINDDRIVLSRNNEIYSVNTQKNQYPQVMQILASFRFID